MLRLPLNLNALSYIALLLGLFLIYNTVSISVISRREEMGAAGSSDCAEQGAQTVLNRRPPGCAAVAARLVWGRLLAYGAISLTSTR